MDITPDLHSWSEESPEHSYTLATAGKPWRADLWLLRPTLCTQAWLRKLALLRCVPHCKNSGAMCSRPDLTGGSKHKSGSTRLPPSASASPHCWHHTGIACSHCTSQQEWTIERNRGDLAGAFKSARNCQEEEKLSIRGMWVLSWPSLTPQERGFTPLK